MRRSTRTKLAALDTPTYRLAVVADAMATDKVTPWRHVQDGRLEAARVPGPLSVTHAALVKCYGVRAPTVEQLERAARKSKSAAPELDGSLAETIGTIAEVTVRAMRHDLLTWALSDLKREHAPEYPNELAAGYAKALALAITNALSAHGVYTQEQVDAKLLSNTTSMIDQVTERIHRNMKGESHAE